ncbi:hypothetical protein ACP70R_016133 [Stipagrostis hirtigluma subsp. patula]
MKRHHAPSAGQSPRRPQPLHNERNMGNCLACGRGAGEIEEPRGQRLGGVAAGVAAHGAAARVAASGAGGGAAAVVAPHGVLGAVAASGGRDQEIGAEAAGGAAGVETPASGGENVTIVAAGRPGEAMETPAAEAAREIGGEATGGAAGVETPASGGENVTIVAAGRPGEAMETPAAEAAREIGSEVTGGAAGVETPASGGEDAIVVAGGGAGAVVAPGGEEEVTPHLDAHILSVIGRHASSTTAYSLAATGRDCLDIMYGHQFLQQHLLPHPIGDVPDAIVFQPIHNLRKGYSHLVIAVVNPDPNRPIAYNLPPHAKYGYYAADVPGATPAPPFFRTTVPGLDVAVVASHGRLLLVRGNRFSFVCDPAENRWVKLPPGPVIEKLRQTAFGFHYVHAASGEIRFTIVLLVRRRRRRLVVHTLQSHTGQWNSTILGVRTASRFLGQHSSGVYSGGSFYWPSRHRIIRYDAATGRVSVFRQAPPAPNFPTREGRSLGSVDGQLRLCTFDIRRQAADYAFEVRDVPAAINVWMLQGEQWVLVRQVVIGDVRWMYDRFQGFELPLDWASSSTRVILVKKDNQLLIRDLETGYLTFLTSLHHGEAGGIHSLYREGYRVFPFHK